MRKLVLSLACVLVFAVCAVAQKAQKEGERHFTFHYGLTVKDVPAGKKMRVWIPAAHSDAFQEVKVLSAAGESAAEKDP